jgi:broad specificity phosphatase PhoE
LKVYLLRHGEVESHRGDVPITEAAEHEARRAGRALAELEGGTIRLLTGETRRARDTAARFAEGLESGGVGIIGPDVAFALRNPDLYVSGVRVNMVSSPEALAAQVGGIDPEDVMRLGFYTEFFASPDRIGWWLTHPDPPGETADAVATRVRAFLISLLDPVPLRVDVVVAITHSPLLRSLALDLLGRDIGEPPWVTGLVLRFEDDHGISAEMYQGDTG